MQGTTLNRLARLLAIAAVSLLAAACGERAEPAAAPSLPPAAPPPPREQDIGNTGPREFRLPEGTQLVSVAYRGPFPVALLYEPATGRCLLQSMDTDDWPNVRRVIPNCELAAVPAM